MSQVFSKLWETPVGYVIAGYNDTLDYRDPITEKILPLSALKRRLLNTQGASITSTLPLTILFVRVMGAI